MKTETKKRVSRDPKDYDGLPVGWMVASTSCNRDGLWKNPITGKNMITFCDDKPPYRDEVSAEVVFI